MENYFSREDECTEMKFSEGVGVGMFIRIIYFNDSNLYYG